MHWFWNVKGCYRVEWHGAVFTGVDRSCSQTYTLLHKMVRIQCVHTHTIQVLYVLIVLHIVGLDGPGGALWRSIQLPT